MIRWYSYADLHDGKKPPKYMGLVFDHVSMMYEIRAIVPLNYLLNWSYWVIRWFERAWWQIVVLGRRQK